MDDISYSEEENKYTKLMNDISTFSHIYFLKENNFHKLLAVDVTLAQKNFPLTTLLRNYSVHLSEAFILSVSFFLADIL